MASLILSLISFCAPVNAAEPVVLSESTLTPSIAGVGNIWTGKIPTKVSFPTNTYCPNLAFPIQGLLPFSVLSDRALGVSVEFEVWAANGSRTSNNKFIARLGIQLGQILRFLFRFLINVQAYTRCSCEQFMKQKQMVL